MTDRLRTVLLQVDEMLARMEIDGEQTDEGVFLIRFGSTVVLVSAFEDADHAYVRVASVVLVGLEPTLTLVTRLLRLNAEVLFGAFQLFDDGVLSFAHTLIADELDDRIFRHALTYVARVSDDLDEELQAICDGRRAEDVLAAAVPR